MAHTHKISDAARADYYAKIASVNADFADSDIGLLKAGLTTDEISQLRVYQSRKQAENNILQLRQSLLGDNGEQSGTGTSAASQSGEQTVQAADS